MYNPDKYGHTYTTTYTHRPTDAHTQIDTQEENKGKEETREKKDRQHSVSESYLIGFPQPDVKGGFSEGVYGLLREHVLQADRAPS